jgi:hypothetical protein
LPNAAGGGAHKGFMEQKANDNGTRRCSGKRLGVCIAIGIGVGVALGAATHNVGVGIAIGVAVGYAMSCPPCHAKK